MTAHTFLRDDAMFAALLGSDLPSGGGVKAIFTSRDMTAASGNVAYTGVGFTPSLILFFGIGANGGQTVSIGADDGVSPRTFTQIQSTIWNTTGAASIFFASPTNGDTQTAKVATFDADGFTLTWTKSNAPTGTGFFVAVCFR